MKTRKHPFFLFTCRVISTLLLFLLPLNPVWLYANPSGEHVVSGSANFHREGATLTIHQLSNKAIINWQDFSIALGELTQFLQPSRSSAVLNRVVGGNISEIYGTLKANGSVFLINPNGVLIGPTGIIEVGSFVASTKDISNEEFLQDGPLNFTGNSTAELVNLGRISAQDDVFLLAEAVRNEGHISAQGEVALAAGAEFYLQQQGEERFKVKLPNNGSARDTGVLNTGQIEAAKATLQATGSAYSVAVNNGGIIRATGVQHTPEGRVFLVGSGGGKVLNSGQIVARNADGSGGRVKMQAGEGTLRHSGQVDVTGTTGGRAELTGEQVAVTGTVDASGQQGGGRVYVGGSYQGRQEPDIANAQRTLVGSSGVLRADAIENGDGGRIIVWADGDTAFHGTLSARGGALGGNGGFAEISGKQALTLTGITDLSAPFGLTGTLLLDPKNIHVVASYPTPVGLSLVDDFADPGTDNYILASTLTGAASNIVLQATNDIYFNASVTMNARDLTLQAGRSIRIGDSTLPHVTITFTTGNFSATINDQNAVAGIPPHSRDAGMAEFRLQNATVTFAASGSGRTFTVNSGTYDPLGGRIRFEGGTAANRYAVVFNADQINLTCQNDIVLQGGSANSTFALLQTAGATSSINLTSTNGNIDLLGSTAAGNNTSYAFINSAGNATLSANNGRILLQGGVGAGTSTANSNYARVLGTGTAILSAGSAGLQVLGGTGNFSYAQVQGAGVNLAQAGSVQVTGGSATSATASITGAAGGVQLNSSGNIVLSGGSSNNCETSITASMGGIQINSVGDVLLQAGSGSSSPAYILSSQGVNINSTNGNIDVIASSLPWNLNCSAFVQSINGVLDMQATNGRIRVHAGGGSGTAFTNSNYAFVRGGSAVTLAAGSGGVDVRGGSRDFSYAEVYSDNGNIDITSDGNITVQAGIGNNSYARIITPSPASLLINLTSTNGNIEILGGPLAASSGAYAQVNSQRSVNMQATNGSIRLQAGAGTGNSAQASASTIGLNSGIGGIQILGGTGFNSFARVLSLQNMNITTLGNVSILGGSANLTSAEVTSPNNGQITANVSGHFTLQGGSGHSAHAAVTTIGDIFLIAYGSFTLQGGSGNNSFARIKNNFFSSTSANISLSTNGNIDILGSTTAGNFSSFAEIDCSGNLDITAHLGRFRVQGGAGIGASALSSNFARAVARSKVAVGAGFGTNPQVDSVDVLGGIGPYSYAEISSNVVVDINSRNNITLQGSTSANGKNASAEIRSGALMLIRTRYGDINLQGGAADGANAKIAAVLDQTILCGGNIQLTGGTATNATNTAISEAIIQTSVGLFQDIKAAGNITLSAGTGDNPSAYIRSFLAPQFVTSTGGNISLFGGTQPRPAQNLKLAVIETSSNTQVISAANQLNLRGDDWTYYSAIRGYTAGTTTLNFNTGTWHGEAYVERPTTNGTIIINNSSKLTIEERVGPDFSSPIPSDDRNYGHPNGAIVKQHGYGYVRADSIQFQGTGTVGSPNKTLVAQFVIGIPPPNNIIYVDSIDSRLNTDANRLIFSNPNKSLYLRELGPNLSSGLSYGGFSSATSGSVTIEGFASILNLITQQTGNILQGLAPLTVDICTLATADGNIDLWNPNNTVLAFNGLIANNGYINYAGQGNTTLASNFLSPNNDYFSFANIPFISDTTTGVANVGVFATGNITLNNPIGTFIVTTDEMRSDAGNVTVNANTLQFNAAGASFGGIHGPSGVEGWVYTPLGTQTYNVTSNIQLLRNTHMRADAFPNDTITFNGDIISPNGVAGLQVDGTSVFNAANVGTIVDPLAYLLFSNNAPSTITFTPNFNSAVINFSLINQNDAQMLINALTPTFIVDHGTVGPGPGLFQGGNMQVVGSLQIFGALPAQVTGNIGGLSPQAYTGQEFWAAWLGAPFTQLIPLPPFPSSFVAYKVPLPAGGGGGGMGGAGLGFGLEDQARDAWQDEDDDGDRRQRRYRNQFKFIYQNKEQTPVRLLSRVNSFQLYNEQLFERSELVSLIQQVERKKGEEVKLMNY